MRSRVACGIDRPGTSLRTTETVAGFNPRCSASCLRLMPLDFARGFLAKFFSFSKESLRDLRAKQISECAHNPRYLEAGLYRGYARLRRKAPKIPEKMTVFRCCLPCMNQIPRHRTCHLPSNRC